MQLSKILLGVASLASLAAASPITTPATTPATTPDAVKEKLCGLGRKCPDKMGCIQTWDQERQEWHYYCCLVNQFPMACVPSIKN